MHPGTAHFFELIHANYGTKIWIFISGKALHLTFLENSQGARLCVTYMMHSIISKVLNGIFI